MDVCDACISCTEYVLSDTCDMWRCTCAADMLVLVVVAVVVVACDVLLCGLDESLSL